MRTSAPPIDLLDPQFYVDGSRGAYRWMRRNAPVYFDEKNRLWGIATYDGVRAAEGNATVFRTRAAAVPTRDRCLG
jgi:cytochrome P450 family 142 subfamily A polypeptide 1